MNVTLDFCSFFSHLFSPFNLIFWRNTLRAYISIIFIIWLSKYSSCTWLCDVIFCDIHIAANIWNCKLVTIKENMRAKRMSRAQSAYYEREVPLAGVQGPLYSRFNCIACMYWINVRVYNYGRGKKERKKIDEKFVTITNFS